VAEDEKLKRVQAGTYATADGRFTVEQSATGWLVLDAEQTNELGLPLARGPFTTLDEARGAIGSARSGPRPVSDLDEHRRSKGAASARARPAPKPGSGAERAAREPGAGGSAEIGATETRGRTGGGPRRAAKRPTGREVVIREIRVSDGDELRRLWKSVEFKTTGDDDRSLARLVRRNPGLVLVATEGGRIVGSALGAFDGRRGWLYHVATAESHRRQGIASKLVDRIEAGLADLGCPKVSVSVGDEREAGRAFWQARGYAMSPARQFGKELEPG
jgi:GNAT superfamily N-acetyltransferase